MGTITGTQIMNKAATLLFDLNNVKWSRPELLIWLNDAQRALVALLPEASSTRVVQIMSAGPRQSIPAAGWMLLDVIGNMGTNGTTRGAAVKRIDGRIFDETNPTWLSTTPAAVVTLAMYNARDKTAFDVFPPSDGTGYLEMLYSALPVDLATEAGVIVVADIYAPALLDYVMFRCKSKEAPFANDASAAAAYYQSFAMYVTGDASQIGRLAAGQGQMMPTDTPQRQGSVGDA